MALGSCQIFSFKTHFRSVNFKGLPARGVAINPERTSYHDFENKFIQHLIWKPKGRDNSRHTVLSKRTGLESLKSIASDGASSWDSFSSIG